MEKKDVKKIKADAVQEAKRYLQNARTILKEKAVINEEINYYTKAKYVKSACGKAYKAVLIVLDAYIAINGEIFTQPKYKRKRIEYYRENIKERDFFLFNDLHTTYNVLYLSGYYGELLSVDAINSGIAAVADMISYFDEKC